MIEVHPTSGIGTILCGLTFSSYRNGAGPDNALSTQPHSLSLNVYNAIQTTFKLLNFKPNFPFYDTFIMMRQVLAPATKCLSPTTRLFGIKTKCKKPVFEQLKKPICLLGKYLRLYRNISRPEEANAQKKAIVFKICHKRNRFGAKQSIAPLTSPHKTGLYALFSGLRQLQTGVNEERTAINDESSFCNNNSPKDWFSLSKRADWSSWLLRYFACQCAYKLAEDAN